MSETTLEIEDGVAVFTLNRPEKMNAISQDMFLAGTIILFYMMLAVVGTLISDILLAWLDPRIRLDEE